MPSPDVRPLQTPQKVMQPASIPLRQTVADKQVKWKRIDALISNDEESFKSEPFCLQLPNERDANYAKRQKWFPQTMVNMSQDLVSSPGNAVFRNGVKVDYKSEKSMLKSFAEDVTNGGDKVPLLRYMRDHIAVGLRAYGTTFTVIDKPSEIPRNRMEEREKGMPYLSNISPLAVINYEFDDAGELLWFAYGTVYKQTWLDPLSEERPDQDEVTEVITRDEFVWLRSDGEVIDRKAHGWGFVPVVIQASFLADPEDVLGISAFETTSNHIMAGNNLLNLAVYEYYKHGGALLLMPEESLTASNFGNDGVGETKLKKQADDSTLTYAGEIPPSFLVKDLAAKDIWELAEWYFQAAVENERDLKSVIKKGNVQKAVVQQSGVAKMMDREPLEANLTSLADDMESWFDKVNDLVSRILNKDNDATAEFDKDYDLRGAKQKLEEIKQAQDNGMAKVTATGMKEMWKEFTPDITGDPEIQRTINEEIDNSDIGKEDELLDEQILKMGQQFPPPDGKFPPKPGEPDKKNPPFGGKSDDK